MCGTKGPPPLFCASERGATKRANSIIQKRDMMPSSSIDAGTIVELGVKYVNVVYMEDDATIFLKNLTATLPLLNFDNERKPNLKMPSMLNV